MIIKEGKLTFDFDDNLWSSVIKYDTPSNRAYQKLEKVKDKSRTGSKAVDILGILNLNNNNSLVFIEIKDIRKQAHDPKTTSAKIGNKNREFSMEVAVKVRDTIAGIIGGSRNSTHYRQDWEAKSKLLLAPNRPIIVILWMEENQPLNQVEQKRRKVRYSAITKILKEKLSWIEPVKAIVTNKYFEKTKPNPIIGHSVNG